MKIAIIGAGKWGLALIGHLMSKVHKTALTLCRLTTRHLVTRLHCNLVTCQQSAHTTSCIKGELV